MALRTASGRCWSSILRKARLDLIGGHLLSWAVDAGHDVHVLARSPEAMRPRHGLSVTGGDVLDPAAVADVISGGPRRAPAVGSRIVDGFRDPSPAGFLALMFGLLAILLRRLSRASAKRPQPPNHVLLSRPETRGGIQCCAFCIIWLPIEISPRAQQSLRCTALTRATCVPKSLGNLLCVDLEHEQIVQPVQHTEGTGVPNLLDSGTTHHK
jgi:hypothetical protein